ncbi:MAG: hypothetical protein WC225_03515 [Acholeplasmataceae bacterium]|nr:hypothetical protein [Acholeplasmataceae bacterium]
MITEKNYGDTRIALIAQVVLSTIYVLFGIYILFVKLVNKSFTFDKKIIISLSLIIIGSIFAIYYIIILKTNKN